MIAQLPAPCAWCGQPADHILQVEKGTARQTPKGRLVTSLGKQLPACADCAHQLYRSNAERARAQYRQQAAIDAAEQLRLC